MDASARWCPLQCKSYKNFSYFGLLPINNTIISICLCSSDRDEQHCICVQKLFPLLAHPIFLVRQLVVLFLPPLGKSGKTSSFPGGWRPSTHTGACWCREASTCIRASRCPIGAWRPPMTSTRAPRRRWLVAPPWLVSQLVIRWSTGGLLCPSIYWMEWNPKYVFKQADFYLCSVIPYSPSAITEKTVKVTAAPLALSHHPFLWKTLPDWSVCLGWCCHVVRNADGCSGPVGSRAVCKSLLKVENGCMT